MALAGDSNEEKIWNYLKSNGLSDSGVAALMGNLFVESKLNPMNMQDSYERKLGMTDQEYCEIVDDGMISFDFTGDRIGWGLAQWTHPSRKMKLWQYAVLTGRSIGNLEMQLEFIMKEMNESYKTVLTALKNTISVRDASDIVLTKYEQPADQSEEARERRASYGMQYYEKYAKEQTDAGVSPLINVNELIALFETMYKEKWKYVWGGAKKGTVDCSGAFVYAFKALGNISKYHSSNMFPRKHCQTLQKNTTNDLPPGVAVFKHRQQTDPALLNKYGDDDYYHMGLVDATGKYVLHAKGTAYGFCKEKLTSSWKYYAVLKDVDYDNEPKINEDTDKVSVLFKAKVTTNTSALRLRIAPNGSQIGKIPKGAVVNVLKDDGDWWYVNYNNHYGYASSNYLTREDQNMYQVQVTTGALRVRKGAGTNYGVVKNIRDRGVYTIVKEADGTGATKWGLLQEYSAGNNGWISLDYTKRV